LSFFLIRACSMGPNRERLSHAAIQFREELADHLEVDAVRRFEVQ